MISCRASAAGRPGLALIVKPVRKALDEAQGYGATLVAGTLVFERGEHTGAKPGRLVRRGR